MCGLLAVLHFSVGRCLHSPAMRIWAASNLAAAVGSLLFALRPWLLPFPVSVLLANGAMIATAGLVAVGIDVFDGRQGRWTELLAGLGLALAGLAFSVSRGDDLGQRILIVSLPTFYFFGRAAWSLFHPPGVRARGRRICAIVLVFFALFYLARGIGVSVGWLSVSGARNGFNGGLTRMLALSLSVTWNFCLLFLALDQKASVDELTGLLNRRATLARGDRMIGETLARHRPVSVLMIDLDHFKAVNDRHGHHVGDAVLRAFAGILRRTARCRDVAGRLGGEEFCLVLRECDAAMAQHVAENLRTRAERELVRVSGQPTNVTISVGIVTCRDGMPGLDGLLQRADQALYRAKGLGRNCSVTLDCG